MSRIGKEPVVIPKEVKVKIEGRTCFIEAAKHKTEFKIPLGISVEQSENTLLLKRDNDTKPLKSLHGTIRALLNNVIEGVTQGFKKELEIVGVGYKAQIKGKNLVLNVGFSQPVEMLIPDGLKVSTPVPTRILVEGIDKQKVGEFSACVRRVCPPEPYKGKGIRYKGEEVRKKLGKALAK